MHKDRKSFECISRDVTERCNDIGDTILVSLW